jgi:Domain of unknown function (DUF4333)
MRVRRAAAALTCLPLVLVLVLAGCGGAKKLDTSRLETQMDTALTKRTGIGIKSVVCPDSVVAKKGEGFRCVATTARNERVVLDVTQDNGKGAVTWRIAKPTQ